MDNWTEDEVAERAEARLRRTDQVLVSKTFARDGYNVEMTIFNDNNATNKWGYRGMFGWIEIYKERRDMTFEDRVKLGYSVTVDLNDWDLSPKYVEHGLMGKLDMYIKQQKDKAECKDLL